MMQWLKMMIKPMMLKQKRVIKKFAVKKRMKKCGKVCG
ncbi:hypothetical protein bwei_2731 [Bacillus mycoides]|nr:hypothetical protein bwei_2731 [Bacillus mycoides]